MRENNLGRRKLGENEEKLEEAHNNSELEFQETSKSEIWMALQKSEEKYRYMVENINDVIFTLDINGNFTYISPTIEKITGYTADKVIGQHFTLFIHPDDQPGLLASMERTLTGKLEPYEFRVLDKKGTVMHVHTSSNLIIRKGQIIDLNGVMTDITERKNAEKEREELMGELRRSNEELKQFAYVASHDLQEPLRTIASFTQLLEMRYKGELDKDADEFIEYVVEATKRMQQMINDLLEYSRVMAGGEKLKPTNVEEVLKKALFNLKGTIDENDAEITYDPLPTVMADSRQLVQLFQNLISNAIKFRKKGEIPEIHISAREDEEKEGYVFSVCDNGIGMDPQFAERVFIIFQRLHTRDKYEGTGIGLAIVKKIIERHNGKMWIESSLGRGSTFYFTIPGK